jgi:hypothetical protein
MRYLVGVVFVLALGTLRVVGCGETAGTGGGGDGETATLQLLAMEFDPEGNQVPLAGVHVCETDTANCDVTDGTRPAVLQLPADRETSYTQVKEGYGAELRADVISATTGSIVVPVMQPDSFIKDNYDRVESPYPMEGTGSIYVQVGERNSATGAIRGATLELVGENGKAFYVLDDRKSWSTDLTATTSAGNGGFVEVRPGEYQIQIGGTPENCSLVRAWPGDSDNSIRLPVREGFETTARVACDVGAVEVACLTHRDCDDGLACSFDVCRRGFCEVMMLMCPWCEVPLSDYCTGEDCPNWDEALAEAIEQCEQPDPRLASIALGYCEGLRYLSTTVVYDNYTQYFDSSGSIVAYTRCTDCPCIKCPSGGRPGTFCINYGPIINCKGEPEEILWCPAY